MVKKILLFVIILFVMAIGVLLFWVIDSNEKSINKDLKIEGSSREFTKAELEKANLALSKGIKIDDPKDDFYIIPEEVIEGDGRPNNYNPYPLGYTDIKSFNMAADEDYLYLKYELWDKFPSTMPSHDGDFIWLTGPSVSEMLFYRDGKADIAQIVTEIMYSTDRPTSDNKVWPAKEPELRHTIMMSPTGFDSTGDNIVKNITRSGMVAGGSGTDYVLSAVPLSIFGLKFGDEIIFSVTDETGSAKYHHESVDLLLEEGSNKEGDKIKYKLGSSTYEKMSVADYVELPDYIEIDKRLRSNSLAKDN